MLLALSTKVSAERLVRKLGLSGVHPVVVIVLRSRLRPRSVKVVVGGAMSAEMHMGRMILEATVWGPGLWKVYYCDSSSAAHGAGFQEATYADDLNAYRAVPNCVPNQTALLQAAECQRSLHRWGHANQVCFDPAKESFHILSRTDGYGDNFTLLGVDFDVQLLMHDAVHACATEAGWRVRSLLRAQ